MGTSSSVVSLPTCSSNSIWNPRVEEWQHSLSRLRGQSLNLLISVFTRGYIRPVTFHFLHFLGHPSYASFSFHPRPPDGGLSLFSAALRHRAGKTEEGPGT